MARSNFERIKDVLSSLRGDDESSFDKFYSDARKVLRSLTDEYKSIGNGFKPIDYSRSGVLAAYAFRTMGAHAEWLRKVLINSTAFQNLIKAEEVVKVAAIEGGPGTEILAVCSYLLRENYKGRLVFTTVDKEAAWARLRQKVSYSFKNEIDIKPLKFQFDIMNDRTRDFDWEIAQSDLVIFSYCLSEIIPLDKKGKVEQFINQLKDRMRAGSLILYVDNRLAEHNDRVDTLFASDLRFKVVGKLDDSSARLPVSEDIKVLKEFTDSLQETPKLKGDICGRIWEKVT